MEPTNGTNGKRSDCPLNFAVETLGDRWSLVILRDMIFWGKHSYGEFLKSDEKIATNILADRLEYLVKEGLISKAPDPSDKRREVYALAEKGIELVPMFLEMIAWSANDPLWQTMDHSGATRAQKRFVEKVVKLRNKAKLADKIQETLRRGGWVFEGASIS